MDVNVSENSVIISEPDNKSVTLTCTNPEPKEVIGRNIKIASDNVKVDSNKIKQDPLLNTQAIKFTDNGSAVNTLLMKENVVVAKDNTLNDNSCTNLLDNTKCNQTLLENFDLRDKSTLSITSSILSAVNAPEIAPLKLTIELLNTDVKKKDLEKELGNGKDPVGIATGYINFAKGSWGTVISGANLTNMAVETGADIGLLSTRSVKVVGGASAKVSSVANKLAIPFAVAGTGLTVWDIVKAERRINEKENFPYFLK